MNEYHPVATLIAVQSWYGKESVFTKGEGNIQTNLLTLKVIFRTFFCFLVVYFLTLSVIMFRKKHSINRKKCILRRNSIEGTSHLYKCFDLTFRFLRASMIRY